MRIASFVRCLAVLGLALLPQGADAQSVGYKLAPEYGAVLAGKTSTLYVLVELDAARAPGTTARAPLNVAVVVDRSGSMADDGKLDHAKAAAKHVIDGLSPGDTLSLLEYDDHVTVMRGAAPLTDRAAAKRQIDRLTPRGGTNLTAGMDSGIVEAVRGASGGAINRVLLLSDGLANQGVTSPAEIARRAAAARRAGVRVSTIGLGLSYDEDLMQAIAESGGGGYHYVADPTQLARIFHEEMSLMLAAVAKDVEMSFAGAGKVTAVEAVGYNAKGDVRRLDVVQPDFFGGEKRLVVLRLELSALPEGAHALGTVRLAYKDLVTGAPQAVEVPVTVTATTDATRLEREHDLRVAAEVALVEAERHHAASVAQYERGDRQGALASTQALSQELTQKNTQLKDTRIAKKLEALSLERTARERADTDPALRASYLKTRKYTAFAGTKGTRTSYMLQEGDSGIAVEGLQRALKGLKLFAGAVDGRFGPELTVAVKTFQQREGLDADGVAGPVTLQKLGLY